jgi:hypothetical protein
MLAVPHRPACRIDRVETLPSDHRDNAPQVRPVTKLTEAEWNAIPNTNKLHLSGPRFYVRQMTGTAWEWVPVEILASVKCLACNTEATEDDARLNGWVRTAVPDSPAAWYCPPCWNYRIR